MDMFAELVALIEGVRKAMSVPFSVLALVNKKDLLERLQGIHDRMPLELQQARMMVVERGNLLARAQADAESILSQARAERDRLVARSGVLQEATQEAERIIDEARNRGQEIRLEAEDYIDAKLANFEVALQKTLMSVTRGRETLRLRLAERGHSGPEAPREPSALRSSVGPR
ncbi:MAG: hypothetical protein ACRDJF_11040 [Actinomycetota bacterium]